MRIRPSWRRLGAMILAIALVALSARLSVGVPGSPVPQSAQTLAVLMVGALLGARGGSLAIAAYVLAGGLGVPVFSGGASGWSHLVGPTAGYLAGFIAAAWWVGRLADRGRLGTFGSAMIGMLVAHALILAVGWVWLGARVGFIPAYADGVAPFLVGGIVKSFLAAAIVRLARRLPGALAPTDVGG